ncbi:enoyl-CoA hydratase/isomerase family protein [Mycobacterium sp. PS03-16]|nr:enoyl-CoA hydratase/isomerase family protein [Mycobacterium sp. PS03-16]
MGLASHAAHRVVTDSTRMGMPEVLIGLSPDVGGLWLYSRAPGRTGVYAALTAAHLSAGDALYMGLADHYVPDDRIDALTARLQQVSADEALREFDGRPPSQIADRRAVIDDMFGASTVAGIAAAVAAGDSDVAELAGTALTGASPTALSVTFEGLRRAAEMTDLAECLAQDLRVGQHCARHPDLTEGIRARVVDKDRNPKWNPPTLHGLGPGDVERFFAPIGTPLQMRGW